MPDQHTRTQPIEPADHDHTQYSNFYNTRKDTYGIGKTSCRDHGPTDPGSTHQHFGDDGGDHADRQGDLQAGQNSGRGQRQNNFPQELAFGRTQGTGRP